MRKKTSRKWYIFSILRDIRGDAKTIKEKQTAGKIGPSEDKQQPKVLKKKKPLRWKTENIQKLEDLSRSSNTPITGLPERDMKTQKEGNNQLNNSRKIPRV